MSIHKIEEQDEEISDESIDKILNWFKQDQSRIYLILLIIMILVLIYMALVITNSYNESVDLLIACRQSQENNITGWIY